MGALALPVMIGAAALGTEYGHALTTQTEHQRVADLASYAGALAYGQTTSEETMRAAALNITTLHGIAASTVQVALVVSPRTANAKAVNVSIRSPQPILLGQILGGKDLTIASDATAEVGGGSDGAGCIIALDPNGTGVTMSGGTILNAPECTVASNSTITSPCGTKIIAKSAAYNSPSAPEQPEWCRTIQKKDGTPAPIAKRATPDPLVENPAVLAAVARIKTVAALKAPTVAGGGGKDLDFNPWDMGKRQKLAANLAEQGCSAVYASIWTVTCDPAKVAFKFGDFLIESGQTVEFNMNGSARATYAFTSIKSQGGGNYRFGPGSYTVAGGITMGGSEARFGAGTFRVGQGPCGFSICGGNNGTMAFDGPSKFELSHGIMADGGLKATFGAGTANSFEIGPSTTGRSVHVKSGSVVFADAKTGVFEAKGRMETGGGTCLALPASTQHDIAGSIDVSGALILGAGQYTIDGFLALGQQYGGAADCNGRSSTSLYAKDVTIVLSGKETATSWACSGAAYCAASGYKDMVLTSPETGVFAQLAVIGPTNVKAGATLTSGASGGQISGAFYFPKGPISLGGGAGASGSKASCLFLLGTTITVSGGTAAASECSKIKGGTGGAGKIAKLVR